MTISSHYPYQTVIFDLDGTLIDSSPSILKCFYHVLRKSNIPPLLPLGDSLIGPPLRQTLINLTGLTDDSLLDRLVDAFKECYDTEGYKAARVYDGVEGMLAHLSGCNIPMAIATNKRRVPTLKILEHLGWKSYFRIVGTLDTPPAHPHKAALIKSLLNNMGASADTTLYVGDKWEDGEAAAANGMAFYAAGWGYGEWDSEKIPRGWRLIGQPIDVSHD